MITNIAPHEHYSLVSPQAFVERMDDLWTNKLGLVRSSPLRTLWGIMATTYVKSISNVINNVQDAPWLILLPPTGSGKTQGACLFAAMQAEANASSALQSVGIIIVTRLIAQADKIASEINEHVGTAVAVAHHSGNRATPQELRDSDVLVITHQAYVNAADNLGSHHETQWERLTTWKGGKRLLTIIDEALANVVETNEVTLAYVSQTLAYIHPELRAQYPDQVAVLESLQELLLAHADPKSRPDDHALRMLWDDERTIDDPNMDDLRATMKLLRYDNLTIPGENEVLRDGIAKRVDKTLKDAQAVMERWAFYSQSGKEHSINSAEFLIPRNVTGPVVLDATAKANFLWDLLGPRSQRVTTPTNVRDYSKVTLHVSRSLGVGKHSMIRNAAVRFPRLLAALEAEVGPQRSVFVCTHKGTEHHAVDWEQSFAQLSTGHWGAIDGRNDWEHCDTAVIFGLPYRHRVWSTGLFMAMQGPQDHGWLESPSWDSHENVLDVMEQRQLSVSVIQAINRIRCRRVIDPQGRSLPADIYIVLPKDKRGDAILADICADMPKLRVVPWAFEMDGPQVKRPRTSASRDALITYMANRLPGETAMSKVQCELGSTPKQLKKLKEALRDPEHATTTALSGLGVSYVVRGAGRGAEAYLVKQAA